MDHTTNNLRVHRINLVQFSRNREIQLACNIYNCSKGSWAAATPAFTFASTFALAFAFTLAPTSATAFLSVHGTGTAAVAPRRATFNRRGRPMKKDTYWVVQELTNS